MWKVSVPFGCDEVEGFLWWFDFLSEKMPATENIGRRHSIPIIYTRGTYYDVGFDVVQYCFVINNFLVKTWAVVDVLNDMCRYQIDMNLCLVLFLSVAVVLSLHLNHLYVPWKLWTFYVLSFNNINKEFRSFGSWLLLIFHIAMQLVTNVAHDNDICIA